MSKIIESDVINQSEPKWQHPVLPGQALQGSLLLTVSDFKEPPQSQANFIWILMEDLIGVANIKIEYDEANNLYKCYKAKGHLDNFGVWHYNWELVASWETLTEEVAEALRNLHYVSYRYDTSINNTLRVYGIKKDMQEDLLCDINFVSATVLEMVVNQLNNSINNETRRAQDAELEERTRAIRREDELEEMIDESTINPGTALEVTEPDRIVNVKVDNTSIVVNSQNELKANIIDDTTVSNDKAYSSSKIVNLIHQIGTYKGTVQTYEDLPTTDVTNGDTYKVIANGNYYMWNGTTWDDLESDYVEGAGIDITNRVISVKELESPTASQVPTNVTTNGLYFNISTLEGLAKKTNGVAINKGDGLDFDSNGKLKIKASDGINVDTNGVAVKDGDGITNTTDGVSINANFNIKTDPLGMESSKLAIYSDGKIAVDFTESPVIITGELLWQHNMQQGQNVINNIYIPTLKDYDMLFLCNYNSTGESPYELSAGKYIQKGSDNTDANIIDAVPSRMVSGTPQGIFYILLKYIGINYTQGTISQISLWTRQTIDDTTLWNPYSAVVGSDSTIQLRIYGMKAR